LSKREYISRYLLIINFLKKRDASWDEISFHLETQSEIEGYNYVISQRTFQRDVEEIRSIYNIDIQNNKSTKNYFIVEEEEVSNNIHLLDTFNLFNALSLTNNYSNYIQFENRIPKGTEHIYGLLHAIKNKFVIELEYHKFSEEKSEIVAVHPYLIKQFKGRWYLLCLKVDINEIRTYALDRIVGFEIRKKHFTIPKDFNAQQYFKNCFGIILPDWLEPEKIVFSFNLTQAEYIKSYPLHESQNIIKTENKRVYFEITVFIAHDFIMELLSYGDEIQIVSPKGLVKTLSTIHKSALKIS
jgi:predicted DNA-binding transcriptional regulator YafY